MYFGPVLYSMGQNALGRELTVNDSAIKRCLNRNIKPGEVQLTDKNTVTRGWQEINSAFPLRKTLSYFRCMPAL